ncbi:MAG TPA: threonine synthase, partial [Candidatus Methylomirabilis sp.]|nr:threonine synthase [Candidatus Methylomirabilis sp.]
MPRLRCTACPTELPWESPAVRCGSCGEPLEVPLETGVPAVRPGRRVWDRFAAFLPFPPDPALDLGEGDAPLLPLPALGASVGLAHLFAKVEGSNPT